MTIEAAPILLINVRNLGGVVPVSVSPTMNEPVLTGPRGPLWLRASLRRVRHRLARCSAVLLFLRGASHLRQFQAGQESFCREAETARAAFAVVRRERLRLCGIRASAINILRGLPSIHRPDGSIVVPAMAWFLCLLPLTGKF